MSEWIEDFLLAFTVAIVGGAIIAYIMGVIIWSIDVVFRNRKANRNVFTK